MTEWIDSWEDDETDPQDGGEPICCWWDDMRSKEVNRLVKEVYERGLAAGVAAEKEAEKQQGGDEPTKDFNQVVRDIHERGFVAGVAAEKKAEEQRKAAAARERREDWLDERDELAGRYGDG